MNSLNLVKLGYLRAYALTFLIGAPAIAGAEPARVAVNSCRGLFTSGADAIQRRKDLNATGTVYYYEGRFKTLSTRGEGLKASGEKNLSLLERETIFDLIVNQANLFDERWRPTAYSSRILEKGKLEGPTLDGLLLSSAKANRRDVNASETQIAVDAFTSYYRAAGNNWWLISHLHTPQDFKFNAPVPDGDRQLLKNVGDFIGLEGARYDYARAVLELLTRGYDHTPLAMKGSTLNRLKQSMREYLNLSRVAPKPMLDVTTYKPFEISAENRESMAARADWLKTRKDYVRRFVDQNLEVRLFDQLIGDPTMLFGLYGRGLNASSEAKALRQNLDEPLGHINFQYLAAARTRLQFGRSALRQLELAPKYKDDFKNLVEGTPERELAELVLADVAEAVARGQGLEQFFAIRNNESKVQIKLAQLKDFKNRIFNRQSDVLLPHELLSAERELLKIENKAAEIVSRDTPTTQAPAKVEPAANAVIKNETLAIKTEQSRLAEARSRLSENDAGVIEAAIIDHPLGIFGLIGRALQYANWPSDNPHHDSDYVSRSFPMIKSYKKLIDSGKATAADQAKYDESLQKITDFSYDYFKSNVDQANGRHDRKFMGQYLDDLFWEFKGEREDLKAYADFFQRLEESPDRVAYAKVLIASAIPKLVKGRDYSRAVRRYHNPSFWKRLAARADSYVSQKLGHARTRAVNAQVRIDRDLKYFPPVAGALPAPPRTQKALPAPLTTAAAPKAPAIVSFEPIAAELIYEISKISDGHGLGRAATALRLNTLDDIRSDASNFMEAAALSFEALRASLGDLAIAKSAVKTRLEYLQQTKGLDVRAESQALRSQSQKISELRENTQKVIDLAKSTMTNLIELRKIAQLESQTQEAFKFEVSQLTETIEAFDRTLTELKSEAQAESQTLVADLHAAQRSLVIR